MRAVIVCIFEHVYCRWALNDSCGFALGYSSLRTPSNVRFYPIDHSRGSEREPTGGSVGSTARQPRPATNALATGDTVILHCHGLLLTAIPQGFTH